MIEEKKANILDMTPKPSAECLDQMIDSEYYGKLLEGLGFNLKVGLAISWEPVDLTKEKISKGMADEIWSSFVWRGEDGVVRGDMKRGDLKFCRAVVVKNLAQGHPQLILQEEPGSCNVVVGHIIVEERNGIVVMRYNRNVDGKGFWELKPSSVSKGDLAESGQEPVAIIYANHQRIGGGARQSAGMAVYVVTSKKRFLLNEKHPEWNHCVFDDSEDSTNPPPIGFEDDISLFDFLKKTDDCRSGFALVKAMLFGT